MDLKIFPVGFKEKDFNDFCKENIVYKYHVIDNGSVYVFYKSVENIGNTDIEVVENLDRIVKQAQVETFTHELDKYGSLTDINTLNEEKNQYHSNQAEWKEADAKIKAKELNVKLADDTIAQRKKQVENAKEMLRDILNKKK